MRRAGPTASGLGVVGLSVLIAIAAATTAAPVTSAATAPPLVPRAVPSPPHSTPQAEPQNLTEAPLPEPPSIDTARVVVNQSNVAVNAGGSSSSRSIVDSAAAHLVVQQGATGLEIASLDVKPGWIEAARAESPTEITLRYVLGSSAVDIRIWANGAGISSSVSASSDR